MKSRDIHIRTLNFKHLELVVRVKVFHISAGQHSYAVVNCFCWRLLSGVGVIFYNFIRI